MLYRLSTLSFLIALLLANFATAAVHWDEMRVMHAWDDIPADWQSLGNTTAGATIKLHIALKPDQESALIDTLLEVSNPKHPRYGAYLSKELVADHVSPHPDTLDLVRAWLLHHGIRPSSILTTHGGEWLTVTDVLVTHANQLLGASYQLYRNLKTNNTIIRTVSYALPDVLHAHIQTVTPTTHFPSSRGMRHTLHRRTSGAAPAKAQVASGKVVTARQDQHVTPSKLRWLYQTVGYEPTAHPDENRLAIVGFDDEYPSQSDLTLFLTNYRTKAKDAMFTVVQLNGGGYNSSDPFDHANVGIQYATAMVHPTPVVFYSVGGDTHWDRDGQPIVTDVYLEWFGSILEEEEPPLTISIPYGEPEQDLPRPYAISVCRLFGQLASRGVTVFAASGKDGVGAGNCVRFIPEFPASCPYVTSVGGTQFFRPEIAANLSGGGFSNYFSRPEYQLPEVGDYLRRYPQFYQGLYNRGGRGYPDISAQALDYEVIVNGELHYAQGTTCAVTLTANVQTVAAIFSLLNDLMAADERESFGFLNPWLYEVGIKGIKDVKSGANPGCGTDGFVATDGWDPVSGLGTLDFDVIMDMFIQQWGTF